MHRMVHIQYIKHHLASSKIKKTCYQEWSTKLILALWDHIYRVWMFQNTWVARYKEEALVRRMDTIWAKKDELRDRLHEFQSTHFNDRTRITNLQYESKRLLGQPRRTLSGGSSTANQDRNIHDARLARYTIRNRMTGSCPSSLSVVLWLTLCLHKFVQISFEKAQLK
jgi:hypothetical protein